MPFIDKHAPQGLEDLIFVDETTKQRVGQYARGERCGNIIFEGPKGTAKSTTARIIADNLIDRSRNDYGVSVYQAADMDEAKIDILQNELHANKWCGGEKNYVVIEEVDQLSPRLQRKLRAILDTNRAGHVIMTTNNVHAVDGPLLDRCDVIEMPAANMGQWIDRAREILTKEGVSITDEQLCGLLQTCNGSIRDLLRALEDYMLAAKQ